MIGRPERGERALSVMAAGGWVAGSELLMVGLKWLRCCWKRFLKSITLGLE